jgi:hypothetical protein
VGKIWCGSVRFLSPRDLAKGVAIITLNFGESDAGSPNETFWGRYIALE